MAVDPDRELFPYCLVWTPIPVITWFIPFVGHMGVCSSKGVIYDFAGSYHIGERELAFGRTTRYLQLRPASSAEAWDSAVHSANACYSNKFHQICLQNCHSHCATVLDEVEYGGWRRWNMIMLAAWMFLCGRFVSVGALFASMLPATLIWGLVIFLSTWLK